MRTEGSFLLVKGDSILCFSSCAIRALLFTNPTITVMTRAYSVCFSWFVPCVAVCVASLYRNFVTI